MNAIFDGYEPYKGDIPTRTVGSLVAYEAGETTSYAMFDIQERGVLFLTPGNQVYSGMIVGRNSRPGDIDVNVCRKKHLTSMRNSAGAEEALKITNYHIPTMEEALEFIDDDELVEITPKSIRMRKRILGTEARKKIEARKKNA
jgi:GTP-binding protein